MRRLGSPAGRRRGVLLAFALLAAGAAPSLSASATTAAPSRARASAAWPLGALPALHATVGDQPGIFDASGRQLVLRGVNLNSLGDYYQANPAYPPTVPVTGADWDSMAAQGFNSVRLLVSWSKLEPTKGVIDDAYLAEIHAAVADAAARGIYSVIDMHQDAWGKYIASPAGVSCPAGLNPSIGWDGAPEWATLTDGADTCNGGSREDSEAVRTAWDSFWSDRDGIRTHLTQVWARLATEFASDPNVAGFDLLNEPGYGHGTTDVKAGLTDYDATTIAAIRQAEVAAGAPAGGHIVFFEYTVNGEPIDPGFTPDTNIVFAPHVYGGSIGPISVSGNWGFVKHLALGYKTAIWSGEYGWFAVSADNVAKLAEWTGIEDSLVAGSAWWQWRQACGDPHSIGTPGGTPGDQVHYQFNGCPGDVNGGVVPEWHTAVGRPYPRAMPGTINALGSNGPDATLAAYATIGPNPASRNFLVWVPDRGTGAPKAGGASVAGITATAVNGGFLVAGTVCGSGAYSVQVGPDAAVAPAACPAEVPTTPVAATSTIPTVPAGSSVTVTGDGTASPAVAVESVPTYTG